MIQLLLVYALAVGSISAAPQLFDFGNGGVGVNFLGYSARAGLGGLLTGNAADGGLSASAGTPFGQRAVAGLGGSTNGNAAGVAFAGAQANDGVGASAGLGGSTGPHSTGFLGAESHSNGVQKTVYKEQVPVTVQKKTVIQAPATVGVVKTYIRPAKRVVKVSKPARRGVRLIKQVSFTPIVSKRFAADEEQVNVVSPSTYQTAQRVEYPVVSKQVTYNPVSQYLNIPIGILQSLQNSLQPIGYSKQVSVSG